MATFEPTPPAFKPKRRSKPMAYFLWALGLPGPSGLHRFYLEKNVTGGVWLVTKGCFMIGHFIDLFRLNAMVDAYNQRQEILAMEAGVFPEDSTYRTGPSIKLQGQALMRRLIQLAAQRNGVLSATEAIAMLETADIDDIEAAFHELEKRGYAIGELDFDTGAIAYRFAQLEPTQQSPQ